eukprot:9359512-Ditylum_brightwellii.AAC.1
MFAARNASQKKLRKSVQLMRVTPRKEESTKPNTKLAKRLTMTGNKILCNIIPMAKDVTVT